MAFTCYELPPTSPLRAQPAQLAHCGNPTMQDPRLAPRLGGPLGYAALGPADTYAQRATGLGDPIMVIRSAVGV